MTATRIGRVATLAVAALLWVLPASASLPWQGLLSGTVTTVIVLAIVLLLAKRFARNWWISAAVILLALGAMQQFAAPYAMRIGTHPIRSSRLAAAVSRLESREHAGHPAVRVQQVHGQTTAANA